MDTLGMIKLINHVEAVVAPARQYYMSKFGPMGKYSEQVNFYGAARFCHPNKAGTMKPRMESLQALRYMPCIKKNNKLPSLLNELPHYITLAQGFPADGDVLAFWATHAASLPQWAWLTKRVLSHLVSSSAPERVFSALKRSFGPQQMHAHEDYVNRAVSLHKWTKVSISTLHE